MQQLRRDPLHGHWSVIAPNRDGRPIAIDTAPGPQSGLRCPFCPGNEADTPPEVDAVRPTASQPNGPGWTVRVVPNKYAALAADRTADEHVIEAVGDLYRHQPGVGAHEVVISTTRHGSRASAFSVNHWDTLLAACQYRMEAVMRDPRVKHVLLFENQGPAAGASLAHAHMQMVGTPMTGAVVAKEMLNCRAHHARQESCLLCDLSEAEMAASDRVVHADEAAVTLAPYASRVPYELLTIPRAHRSEFGKVPPLERRLLAAHLRTVLEAVDHYLDAPSYNWVLHTAPKTSGDPELYHWHVELLPRLTHLAGFELGSGSYINSTAPEHAAARLRSAIEV